MNYRDLLQDGEANAEALCAAAATLRSHLAHRLSVVADSREQLRQHLDSYLVGETSPSIIAGEVATSAAPVFVFSGQGPQWWAMGRELLRNEPAFRDKIDECDALLREFGDWSLIEELLRDERTSRMNQTAIAQPAIFAVQVALAALWQSWGVCPAATVGHSVGEVAAAHVAGALSLREAAHVIFHRGRSMDAAPTNGRMLAASLRAEEANQIAAKYPGEVSVAAVNSPASVTFSGEPGPLEEIARTLEAGGVFNRLLQVNYAFHSHQMDPSKKALLQSLGKVKTTPANLPLYSTVTGVATDGRDLTAEYWWRNVRMPVRFSDAIDTLAAHGHNLFLELSAHPVLTGSIAESLAARGVTGQVFFSLRRKKPEMDSLLKNLGGLYANGSPVRWKGVYPQSSATTSLPPFPWQRERHWRESSLMRAARLDSPVHPLLTVRLATAEPAWNTWLDLHEHAWLKDHRIQDHIVFPGAGYIEAALGMGRTLFDSLPLEVEGVEFIKALVLQEGKEPTRMQADFSAANASVQFSSLSSDGSEWTLHARSKLRRGVPTPESKVDLKKLRAGREKTLGRQEIYSACAQRGLHYGPMFQAIESVSRSETSLGEVVGKIVLPNALEANADEYQIHPSLLDACLQVAMFAAPDSGDQTMFLPSRIDRLTLITKPGKSLWCHASLMQASAHTLVWNFKLISETGHVLLRAEGFRAQAVRQVKTHRSEDPANWLYEAKWIRKPLALDAANTDLRIQGTWLILADHGGVAEKLAAQLEKRGAIARLIKRNECEEFYSNTKGSARPSIAAHLRQRIADAGDTLSGVLHLWSLDAPETHVLTSDSLSEFEAASCHSMLHLVQSLNRIDGAMPLMLVTRNAQSIRGDERVSVAQSPLLGVGRTLLSEFPRLNCRMIDLDNTSATNAAQILFDEIVASDQETEAAWRKRARMASRIAPVELDAIAPRTPAAESPSYQLRIPASGVMDELALHASPRRKPGPNEIEIEVRAAALNFRDVMKLLGIYPMESDRDMLLGDECAGRVVAVGRKVQGLRVGDEVIANGAGCFASHLTVPAPYVVRKPAQLSFEQAATLPVAFMTAWYALHELGRIRRGERVLIHSGTGGVGLAAIQIAQLAGAEIFATAGTEEKRAYLRKLGIRHVMDSRTTAFAAEIRALTNDAGVDLVLNSLAGDAIEKSIACLAPGGRFLEIGKRDIYANTPIGLRPFRNNLSLFVIDMGQVMANQPDTVQSLLKTILKLVRNKKLHPLPHETLPIANAADAFRDMAQAKHIGKIVLTTKSHLPLQVTSQDAIKFSPTASYLVTGGLGGFGLTIARWLIENGARNLVLSGRTGAATPEARRSVAALKRLGAKVLVIKADVGNESQVTRMFARIKREMPTLRGVFHAAMVLDDGPLRQLTPERFTRVMAPKANGAWNLHTASLKLKLDHFVLFSSVSAVVGAAGQANYAAANCFLDALAQYRHSRSLPALSVNWGALADVGVVARNSAVAAHLNSRGVYSIAPSQATQMLGQLLQRDAAQIGFMHIDWQKLVGGSPGGAVALRFSMVFRPSKQASSDGSMSPRDRIGAVPTDEKHALAVSFVAESVAKVLRTTAVKVEPNRPLREIGLDSLMAIELLNRLETQFGASLPTSKVSSSATVASLASVVLDALIAGAARPRETESIQGLSEMDTTLGKCSVAMRASGLGDPLILIHPAGGVTGVYQALASELPPGFPVIAFQSRTLVGARDEFGSLRAMANGYADLVENICPVGGLRVAGFSAGGLFALATAHELERRGRSISLLGMIETPVEMLSPGFPRVRVLANLIAEVYDQLAGESPGTHKNNGAGLTRSIDALAKKILATGGDTARMQLILKWLPSHGVKVGDADSGLRKFILAMIHHAELIEDGEFLPVKAPVWLGRAKGSWLTDFKLTETVRKRITSGDLTQETLAGRHFELMRAPLVRELAVRFGAALEANTANVTSALSLTAARPAHN